MKLRISPAARITSNAQGVLLQSDLGTYQLHGADVKVFAKGIEPLLDGSRDADAVAAALPGYSRSSVLSFLELLRQRGLVEEAGDAGSLAGRSKAQERFFQPFGGEALIARLRHARVLIVGHEPWGAAAALELAASGVGAIHLADEGGRVSAEDLLSGRALRPGDVGRLRRDALREALERSGDGCAASAGPLDLAARDLGTTGGPFSLLIAAIDPENRHLLQRLARFAQAAGLPSLHGHLEGFESWVGPVLIPGQTACWNCLRLRRLAIASAAAAAAGGPVAPGAPSPPAQALFEREAALLAAPPAERARALLAPMAAQTGLALAIEALRLLSGFAVSPLLGRFQVLSLLTQEAQFHSVIPQPWCEVCGGAAALLEKMPAGAPAIQLEQLPDVAALRRVLAGWVDERTGIIPTLTGASGDAGLPPPLTASAWLAAYTDGSYDPGTAGQIGSGKGITALSAHVGAVGEAIERYSAARYRLDRLKLAGYHELDGPKIDPRRLSLYDDSQYASPGFPFARYSVKRPIHWVPGRWIDSGDNVWVPALVAYFNFQPREPGEYFCQVSSNGLAAGSSVEDAALRATFELIERDAAMLVWLARLEAPRILPDESLDPASRQVIADLAARGVATELYLFDAGIGIPTVFCLGLGDGRSWPGVTVSLATHTDPRRAASKAILEQAHVGPYLTSLLPKTRVPANIGEVLTLEDHASYYFPPERQAAFAFLRNGKKTVQLGELPDAGPPTLATCAARLAAIGSRVAYVDVTSPDVMFSPFRVARAVGLDLVPIHFGSRLRRLGNPRLKKLLGKKAINPHPHPIA